MANPEDREHKQFRIGHLKSYVEEHQCELVTAACTIIQFWINQGMPTGTVSKASYEEWAAKMSGLFDCLGVKGFLETPVERRPEDPDEATARQLFIAMDRAHRGLIDPSGVIDDWGRKGKRVDFTKPVRAGDVLDIVNAVPEIDMDFGFKDAKKAMAEFLNRFKGRIIEVESDTGKRFELKLDRAGTLRGTAAWYVSRSVVS